LFSYEKKQTFFFRRYSSHVCRRCQRIIQENEIILRAEQHIFHLECFTCNICNIRLHPGDEFGLKDNFIYCREHFFEQQQQSPYDSHAFHDDSGYHTSPNETRQPKTNEEDFVNFSPPLLSSSYYIETDDNLSHHTKQKRLRTSFKHHQIRCMRLYFNLNHNPGFYFLFQYKLEFEFFN